MKGQQGLSKEEQIQAQLLGQLSQPQARSPGRQLLEAFMGAPLPGSV